MQMFPAPGAERDGFARTTGDYDAAMTTTLLRQDCDKPLQAARGSFYCILRRIDIDVTPCYASVDPSRLQ
jgi:hypothetical protein